MAPITNLKEILSNSLSSQNMGARTRLIFGEKNKIYKWKRARFQGILDSYIDYLMSVKMMIPARDDYKHQSFQFKGTPKTK